MGKWFSRARSKLAKKFALADKLTMLLAVLLVAGSLVTVVPTFAANEVDSNLGGTDVSISRFSEVMAESFNNGLSNAYMRAGQAAVWMNTVDANTDWGARIGLGTIGNLLGYPSGNDSTQNTSNVWTKGTDAASKVMTLQTVSGFYGDVASEDSAMSQYIVFGDTLNYLGIDEFRDAQNATDGIRTIIGYAMYVCFMLAYSAGSIMQNVVSLMEKFNIFQLMWDGTLSTLAGANIGDNKFVKEIEYALVELKSLRWAIFGILVVLFVASVTIWKSKSYNNAAMVQEKGRRLFYRIIVMAIGLPLCGMIYSEALLLIDASAISSSKTLTDYVFQEFLDFEKWTVGTVNRETGESTAFKVDGDATGMSKIKVEYTTDMQQFIVTSGDEDESVDASRLVFAINRTLYPEIGDINEANFVQSLFKAPNEGGEQKRFSDIDDSGNNLSGDDLKKAYNAARNLILNYAKSNVVSPDTLNDVFLQDYDDMLLAMGQDTDSETISTAIEQLFGVEAAEQRIWSYIAKERLTDSSHWVYEHDNGDMDLPLAGTADKKIMCTSKGIAAFPSSTSYANAGGVYINGTKIMVRTLANGNAPTGDSNTISVSGTKSIDRDGANSDGYKYVFEYDLGKGGMSALSLYNYMHTKFENGQITVYSPDNTTNAGVGLMHYSVTTPYSGIPEIVQLLYILAILFCLGIIGWVFGISLLMNTIVQSLKAIPTMFKMFMGSVDSLVEGFLIVLSIAAELLVTVFLYSQAVAIIDLLIELVRFVAEKMLSAFSTGSKADPESYAIMSGIVSIFIIVWGTFQLIRWRQAITISIKSIITHLLNTVFGTSAQMPTGASNGMLKGAAMLGAGAMAMGALAEDGALDDVVNDLTGTDLGSSLHDKISEGDWEGALQDMQDYAHGDYRSQSDPGDINSANGWQSLTDDDKKEMDETWGQQLKDADQAVEDAEQNLKDGKGTQEDVDKAKADRDELRQKVAEDAAHRRHANYEKAQELGVADYGDYLRDQAEEYEEQGLQPIEGADLPDEPSKQLDRDGHMAYDAAKDGDAQTLRSAARIYDKNGLNAKQRDSINEMVKDGASETEIAAAIDNFKQENFGDDADKVVDKINEAAGRSGTETYGDPDNSDGNARTVSVGSEQTADGLQYSVTDNNNPEEGTQTIKATDKDGQSVYENVTAGSKDKGDKFVTADFGSQQTADSGAMTYGQIHNNVDSLANMSGGLIVKGEGDGGGGVFGIGSKTTVSEAAADYASQQANIIAPGGKQTNYGQGATTSHLTQAMSMTGVTDLSQAGSVEQSGGVVIQGQPTAQFNWQADQQIGGYIQGSMQTQQLSAQVAPPSSDGIIYVQGNNGYTVATGAEPPSTPHFVMQKGDDGKPTYAPTLPGTKYVQNPNGDGYIPQGVAPSDYTPMTIPLDQMQDWINNGGQFSDPNANPGDSTPV